MISVFEEYHLFLKLEKALSDNSIKAYESDLQQYKNYLADARIDIQDAQKEHIRDFFIEVAGAGIHPRSQARMLSSIRSFYHFLNYKNI